MRFVKRDRRVLDHQASNSRRTRCPVWGTRNGEATTATSSTKQSGRDLLLRPPVESLIDAQTWGNCIKHNTQNMTNYTEHQNTMASSKVNSRKPSQRTQRRFAKIQCYHTSHNPLVATQNKVSRVRVETLCYTQHCAYNL